MGSCLRLLALLVVASCGAALISAPAAAQLPFYTDDPAVTDNHILHFEFFNEYDGLQSSEFPNLNQNTANFKVNYGLPHNLEADVDVPYLNINRSSGNLGSAGGGDTDLGLKWEFLHSVKGRHRPAMATSFYLELPTGNVQQQLGSGLSDYWLNTVLQEPFTEKTRVTGNFGFLFAGNTSTGVLGTQNTRGHVYTFGLSMTHDFTPRLTLGAEVYGGIADAGGLGKNQLQFLSGGTYQLRDGLSVAFAALGGKYEASPRIGGQVGFAVDIPTVLQHAHHE